ncbi:hypothetical protein CC79DRAFT_1365946 [Sarocladium strictum]|jgi:ribosomal protein S18 acetylase RimI-like enzyme
MAEAPKMYSVPATEYSFATLANLVNTAFEGYIGTVISCNAKDLEQWFPANYVAPAISHIIHFSEPAETKEPVAFGVLSARDDRPGEIRLTSMGVIPAFQGKGTGSKALQLVIDAERKRGTRLLELECIQQNERGVKLYTRAGFTKHRELWGWQKTAASSAAPVQNPDLQQCSVEEVDAILSAHAAPDLPWQARGMVKLAGVGYRLGHAYCALQEPKDGSDTVFVMCLIVEPEWRRKGEGRRLAEAILAKYPDKKIVAKPQFPRENGEEFAKALGAEVIELKQYQMRLEL